MARVALVTGSTDGIGRQTARELASRGMRVIVHGRSKVKVDATLAALQKDLPGAELEGLAFDLGSLAAVRRGAEQLLAMAPELHVLVNNAGIYADERTLTADGIELTFAVNHVAPFLLTELLKERLEASATAHPEGTGSPGGSLASPSKVINVSSIAHTRGKIAFDDITLANSFTGYGAYAQSKLANVMHAMALAERHAKEKLVAYSLHPGVIGTKLLRQGFGPVQGSSVETGAKTSVRLAVEDGAPTAARPASGAYFSDGVETQPSTAARDPQQRAALWDLSVRLAKL